MESDKHTTGKICLLGMPFTTTNLGVSALGASCIKGFKKNFPDAQIVLLDYGKTGSRQNLKLAGMDAPVKLINLSFSKKIWARSHIVRLLALSLLLKLLPRYVKSKIVQANSYLKTIAESTIVGAISAGDSFSDVYGTKRFLYVALPQLLVLLLGRKLILLPQTYGPYKRLSSKILARYILSRAAVIYSRDLPGISTVKHLLARNAASKICFCPDVAFILEARRPQLAGVDSLLQLKTNNSIIVGLNVSGLLFNDASNSNRRFNLKVNYRQLLHSIIESLLAKERVIVVLVPHVVNPNDDNDGDLGPSLRIYKNLADKHPGRIFVVRSIYDQSEIKYVIGLCDFFLGSRMHSCIAALSQMVPSVALAYSSKFSGVFDSVGVGNLVIDLRSQSQRCILASVTEIFSQRQAIARKLWQTIPKAQETISKVFSAGLQ